MDLSYTSIKVQFQERFGLAPQLFRAPGRINLIGEHTDYNDGFVMPAAIDREIVFAIAPSPDSTTVIHAANVNETRSVDLEHIAKDENGGWINYLLGVIDKIQSRQQRSIAPFKCLFLGNIPTGSGLSSSAALECGFVYGLNAMNKLGIPEIDMIGIAQWSEHQYAGVRCGIMDQFASMMGRKDHVFMLDCRSLEYRYFPFVLSDYELVLFDSGVKHALANSEYNTRRGECEEGVRILQQVAPGISSLRDVNLKMAHDHKHLFPDKVFDRVLYVTGEIERVQAAAADLERGDLPAFGKKMNETHRGLAELYEVSCPELDFLVNETLINPDVLGSRMMGGGFGGCVIAIIRSSAKHRIEQALFEKYRRAFGIELKVYEVTIADGAGKIE